VVQVDDELLSTGSTLGGQWADQSVRLCMCNHVGRLVVCMSGAQGRWSKVEVKVMRARANGPGEVKGEC
jgi:hypothetical protein